MIDPEAIYLCDSGGQYIDGTTDTTRTLHFGKPTATEKEANTLVLKGHIALDMAVFPKGTTGFALDSMARQHLWVRILPFCPASRTLTRRRDMVSTTDTVLDTASART